MAIPLKYNLRNLWVRKVSTAMTLFGFSLVVAILIFVMAMTHGLATTYTNTGDAENMILLRQGALAEANSGVTRDAYNAIHYLAGIKRNLQGEPLVSPELVTQVLMERKGGAHETNLGIRGVLPIAQEVHGLVRIAQGRFMQAGQDEVVVGKALSRRFKNMDLGNVITFNKKNWRVVGIFEARGSALESEIWADLNNLMNVFARDYFSSINLKIKDPKYIPVLKAQLEADPRLNIHPFSENEYYESQSENVRGLQALGMIVANILAIGAIFGAMNTMYASIAGRTKEIGTLRALGFSARSILLAFLLESLAIALAGGALGCLLALPFNGFRTGTMNFRSFTVVEFEFKIAPQIFFYGILFSAIMGLAGGYLPARQASRLEIVKALREV